MRDSYNVKLGSCYPDIHRTGNFFFCVSVLSFPEPRQQHMHRIAPNIDSLLSCFKLPPLQESGVLSTPKIIHDKRHLSLKEHQPFAKTRPSEVKRSQISKAFSHGTGRFVHSVLSVEFDQLLSASYAMFLLCLLIVLVSTQVPLLTFMRSSNPFYLRGA